MLGSNITSKPAIAKEESPVEVSQRTTHSAEKNHTMDNRPRSQNGTDCGVLEANREDEEEREEKEEEMEKVEECEEPGEGEEEKRGEE